MQEIIINSLVTQLDLNRDSITMDSRFVEDFSMDSLDMVEMLINLEKETGIKVPVDLEKQKAEAADSAERDRKVAQELNNMVQR